MSTPMRANSSSNTLGPNFTVHYQMLVKQIGGCPLEMLEMGGYAQRDHGMPLETIEECEHGRRPGDVCPSPVVSKRQVCGAALVQNWPFDVPCSCWGGK